MRNTGYAIFDHAGTLQATNSIADIFLDSVDCTTVRFENLFLESELVARLLNRAVPDCHATIKLNNQSVNLHAEPLRTLNGSLLQVKIIRRTTRPEISTALPETASAYEYPAARSPDNYSALTTSTHPFGLANFSPHGLLLISGSFEFLAANTAFFEMTHLHQDDAQGRGWLAALPMDESQFLAKALTEANWENCKPIERECRLVSPLGNLLWVRLIGRRVVATETESSVGEGRASYDNDELYNYVLTFDDIDQRKQSADINLRLANYDSLTGLPNRRDFEQVLTECVRARIAQRSILAVLFIDLDGFKQVNDIYGHDAGDRLLKKMAKTISDAGSRAKKVARLGGDEFTVLLTDVKRIEEVKHFASKLNVLLQDKLSIKGIDTPVSASIGIAMHHKLVNDRRSTERIVNDLLRHADEAMYAAKNAGKNCYVFYGNYAKKATQSRSLQSTDNLIREVSRAITKNELFVEYQPQVETKSGRGISCEALVRWRHQREGLIGPSAFVPLIESNGSMGELTIWLIKRICQDIRNSLIVYPHSARSEKHLSVSVNLAPAQIQDLEILEAIDQIIKSESLPAERFLFEITERTLISDPAAGHSGIDWLRTRGYRVALDDFGTGYSSLAYLHRFALDEIKLDGSFIKDVENSHASRTVVNSVVELAHALGIRVTAEGVEQETQLRYLDDIGCDQWQGYLMSPAIAPADFMALIRSQSTSTNDSYTRSRNPEKSASIQTEGRQQLLVS